MVTLAIIGAGNRGTNYASFAAAYPERARVVAVAEPRAEYRASIAAAHRLEADATFSSWEELVARPKLADAVIIATQDALHTAPALRCAALGYHILLEKPMAPTEEECVQIVTAVKSAGVNLAVGHVLRYTRYTRRLKEILAAGAVGEIVSVQHLEPVGYWHQAHSFVRGNWRSTRDSASMLMAKSCHDLDWLSHIIEKKCEAVSSFGGLHHFRPEQRPQGAADRCLDCGIEPDCAYSARKIYLGRVARGQTGWPVEILSTDTSAAGIEQALRHGPYGRCVYACDNDVVDHQVANMRFSGGVTASFTMTAFTEARARETKIFGTRGELTGDGRRISVHDFLTDETNSIDSESGGTDAVMQGHGGGDFGLMDAFVRSISEGDASLILSGPDQTLESHRMVFAAERARLGDCVVRL